VFYVNTHSWKTPVRVRVMKHGLCGECASRGCVACEGPGPTHTLCGLTVWSPADRLREWEKSRERERERERECVFTLRRPESDILQPLLRAQIERERPHTSHTHTERERAVYKQISAQRHKEICTVFCNLYSKVSFVNVSKRISYELTVLGNNNWSCDLDCDSKKSSTFSKCRFIDFMLFSQWQ